MEVYEIIFLYFVFLVINKITSMLFAKRNDYREMINPNFTRIGKPLDFSSSYETTCTPPKIYHTSIEVIKFFHEHKALKELVFDNIEKLQTCPNLELVLQHAINNEVTFDWNNQFDAFSIKCKDYDVIVFEDEHYVLNHDCVKIPVNPSFPKVRESSKLTVEKHRREFLNELMKDKDTKLRFVGAPKSNEEPMHKYSTFKHPTARYYDYIDGLPKNKASLIHRTLYPHPSDKK